MVRGRFLTYANSFRRCTCGKKLRARQQIHYHIQKGHNVPLKRYPEAMG